MTEKTNLEKLEDEWNRSNSMDTDVNKVCEAILKDIDILIDAIDGNPNEPKDFYEGLTELLKKRIK